MKFETKGQLALAAFGMVVLLAAVMAATTGPQDLPASTSAAEQQRIRDDARAWALSRACGKGETAVWIDRDQTIIQCFKELGHPVAQIQR